MYSALYNVVYIECRTERVLWLFAAVLFPRHTCPEARDNTINLIHTLRDYLHYHIKCSKVCETFRLLSVVRCHVSKCRHRERQQLITSGILPVRENWKKSGDLSGQGKVRGKYFLVKSGKMKNWCYQMSDFQAKMHQIRFPLELHLLT